MSENQCGHNKAIFWLTIVSIIIMAIGCLLDLHANYLQQKQNSCSEEANKISMLSLKLNSKKENFSIGDSSKSNLEEFLDDKIIGASSVDVELTILVVLLIIVILFGTVGIIGILSERKDLQEIEYKLECSIKAKSTTR